MRQDVYDWMRIPMFSAQPTLYYSLHRSHATTAPETSYNSKVSACVREIAPPSPKRENAMRVYRVRGVPAPPFLSLVEHS